MPPSDLEQMAREWIGEDGAKCHYNKESVATLTALLQRVREGAFQEAHDGGVLYQTIRDERDEEWERAVKIAIRPTMCGSCRPKMSGLLLRMGRKP